MRREPGPLTLSEADRRVLAAWAADCAGRTLSLFEAGASGDARPRAAIDGLRAFARGEMRIGQLRALSAQAHPAARQVSEPAARAAARAAGHAAATAHMAAHARGAAAYAALAAGLSSVHAGGAQRELSWQLRRVSPPVRAALRRLPPPPSAGGSLASLIDQLHAHIARDN